MPQEHRRPFQQEEPPGSGSVLLRMEAAVPQSSELFVQAWLSSWDEPRAGIAKLRCRCVGDAAAHRHRPPRRHVAARVHAAGHEQDEAPVGGARPWRKPRPQKGTGRSRQGSIRSPLWVGGGHAHPKRPRDFSYKLNRKVVSLGVKTALSDKYRRNCLIVLRDLELASDEPEELKAKLTNLGIDFEQQRGVCVCTPRQTLHSHTSHTMRAAGRLAGPGYLPRLVCKFRASA